MPWLFVGRAIAEISPECPFHAIPCHSMPNTLVWSGKQGWVYCSQTLIRGYQVDDVTGSICGRHMASMHQTAAQQAGRSISMGLTHVIQHHHQTVFSFTPLTISLVVVSVCLRPLVYFPCLQAKTTADLQDIYKNKLVPTDW